MEKKFKFALKEQVEISRSGETGIIVCRMDATDTKDQFKVQYKAADGRAVGGWFHASELKAVKVVPAKEKKEKQEPRAPKKKAPKAKKVRSKKAAKKK